MLRRVALAVYPALFALAVIFATPATGVSSPAAAFGKSTVDAGAIQGTTEIVRGSITPDVPDDGAASADVDDSIDHVALFDITIDWPAFAVATPFAAPAKSIAGSHRPCAGSPRAPPTV